MKRVMVRLVRGSLLVATLAITPVTSPRTGWAASPETEDSKRLYVRRIAPLLREKCSGCHGADQDLIEGSVDLTSRDAFNQPGDSGERPVEPGDAAASPLYLAVLRDHDDWSPMPPKEAESLSAEQVEWIRSWIDSGAAWPSQIEQAEIEERYQDAWSVEDGVIVETSGGLSETWTKRRYDPAGLWAYQPVSRPQVDQGDGRHPIDQLIERQIPEGLAVAPRADRRTLIRRATFDLHGLPPKPSEVEAFVKDPRNDKQAFAAVIDRLLESPHYGERMAQHWLDVVRYADSSGFANDFQRGNAWRYRDYVVRSFNDDKPYDEFVREQIAGDELDPQDPEKLIATGFLRMGPWELTGMEVAKVARQRFLDDVTNSVGETFLAHSLQCARCHDHKFDPVPTRDYYSIQAVFATTQLVERRAEFLPQENVDGFGEQKYLEARAAEYRNTLDRLGEVVMENAEAWFAETGLPRADWDEAVREVSEKAGEGEKVKRGIFNAARSLLMRRGVPEEKFPPKSVGFTPQQFGMERVARKGLERLRWETDRYRPFALSVYDGPTPQMKGVYAPIRMPGGDKQPGELEQTCILTGGSPFAPADPVDPGVLSLIDDQVDASIPESISGRRLAFAEWVADPNNPLTTRTIANRIWLWHFNEPIAGNPNNFGSTGKRPTHPELLDYLAASFVKREWKFKSMHRHIMQSDAYCRSSKHPDHKELQQLDPTREAYAVFKPRRLTAEELRDAMLAATAELNTKLGGIPCRPIINQEVALQPRQVMGTFAAAWVPNPRPEERNRRSIYILRLRGLMHPMLEVFNSPAPDFSCERRQASTVTPQVFALFNGVNTHNRAMALAHRVLGETDSDHAAVRRCFELTLGRSPTDAELRECLEHWQQVQSVLPNSAPDAESPPLNVTREAVEENTGENFRFQETLYSNQDFVADLQPDDLSLHGRALADLCLVLLNSNEFIYVY